MTSEASRKSQSNPEADTDNLYPSVIRNNLFQVRSVLKRYPHYINRLYCGETLLDFPCRNGQAAMVELLIENGIDVNNLNRIGNPPLVNAIVYDQFYIVRLLCQHKSKVEGIQLENNLTIMDLALLHGRYNIAQYIYARLNNKELKTPDEYQHIAQKYYLRYVNYEMMIEGIKNGKLVTQIGDISARPILSIDTEEEEEEQSCCCCPYSFFEWKYEPKRKERSEPSEKRKEEIEVETDRKNLK